MNLHLCQGRGVLSNLSPFTCGGVSFILVRLRQPQQHAATLIPVAAQPRNQQVEVYAYGYSTDRKRPLPRGGWGETEARQLIQHAMK
jgi:hypothetical protein